MDLYEACEQGNEERVVELLLYAFIKGDIPGQSTLSLSRGRARSSLAVLLFHVASQTTDFELDDGSGPPLSPRRDSFFASIAATINRKNSLSPHELIQTRGTAGRTALHAACLGGQANVVRLLLGETCDVYFTSRTKEQTTNLLIPLIKALRLEDANLGRTTGTSQLLQVQMATKDGGDDLVPLVNLRLSSEMIIPSQDLVEGIKHVDDFGNTPLQCISCFGCGSTEKHIDDGLEITKQLLLHGDHPNLPKHTTKWTPLHWSAYNGNVDQTALLLDPVKWLTNHHHDQVDDDKEETLVLRFDKTQYSIPLVVNNDNLFPVDIAGRRGLTFLSEMDTLKAKDVLLLQEHEKWRLRLDHQRVIELFVQEFLSNASQIYRYVNEMNLRVPFVVTSTSSTSISTSTSNNNNIKFKSQNKAIASMKRFSLTDVIRYGQHLLYWVGCYGLLDHVKALLDMYFETQEEDYQRLHPLYPCSCEEHKIQSVLHAVCAHGRPEIVELLLERVAINQRLGLVFHHHHHRFSPVGPNKFSSSTSGTQESKKSKKKRPSTVMPIVYNDTMNSKQIEVEPLISQGWCNHRNETPLFLATLYLQTKVVQVFCDFLTKSSLLWEVQHGNVEGSYVHHLANETIRQLLGMENDGKYKTTTNQPEYVMLFDGIEKHLFKESIIETLREESALTPSLEVVKAGSRQIGGGTTSKNKKQIDYVLIGASEQVLIQHAETLRLKVKHRGSTIRSTFKQNLLTQYEPFRSLQKQQVIFDIVQKNLNLKKHMSTQNIQLFFPLHDAVGCQNIIRQWVFDSQKNKRIFQPFYSNSLRQFLTEKRTHQYEMLWPLLTYFGEKYAFYFAFLQFYTVWLLMIGLPGLIVEMLTLKYQFITPLFAICVSLWASFLVERWKRKKSEILNNFGIYHRNRNRNEISPEFYGDFQVLTNKIDVKFPKRVQLLRIYAGIPILFTMASMVVLVFIGVKFGTAKQSVVEFYLLPYLPLSFIPFVIPFVNAICMITLDAMYQRIALALTQWENHRTVWEYESMLASKLFWFKFLNAFISLFWVAFVEKDPVALRKQLITIMGTRQLWYLVQRNVIPLFQVKYKWKKAGFEVHSSNNFWSPEWYHTHLKSSDDEIVTKETKQRRRWRWPWQRKTVTAAAAVVVETKEKIKEIATEAIPEATAAVISEPKDFVVSNLSTLVQDKEDTTTTTTTKKRKATIAEEAVKKGGVPPIVLIQELMQPPDFLLGKQMEIVLQYGYITMFISVLPIGPLLALVSNVLTMRLDAICCTQVKKRPPFESETEVSTFMSILEFMSFAALSVNCAVLFFTTTNELDDLLDLFTSWYQMDSKEMFYLKKIWVLILVEHIVLGFKALISLAIDDDASWVQQVEDKEKDERGTSTSTSARLDEGEMATATTTTTTQVIDDLLSSVTDQVKKKKKKKEKEDDDDDDDDDKEEGEGHHSPHRHHRHHRKHHHHHRHKTTHDTTTTNMEILAERYAQALEQRDEAIRREQQAQELLAQYMITRGQQPPLQQLSTTGGVVQQLLPPVVVTSPRTQEGKVGDGESKGGGRFCFVCFVIKEEKTKVTRRCLECRHYFCETCDRTVHLDDLGVKSTKHFRLNASSNTSNSTTTDQKLLPSLSIPTTSSSPRKKKKLSSVGLTHQEQDQMKELKKLIQEYLSTHQSSSSSSIEEEEGQEVEGILERSHQDIQLMLRYLRNARVVHVSRENTRRKSTVKQL